MCVTGTSFIGLGTRGMGGIGWGRENAPNLSIVRMHITTPPLTARI